MADEERFHSAPLARRTDGSPRVMAGLVPAIHGPMNHWQAWMSGTRPGMTGWSGSDQTVKLAPQPQDAFTFGLSILND
jgi:hypothetical protein